MKTFTARQVTREPSEVFRACDREGKVRIRHRDGRVYTLKSELSKVEYVKSVPDFAARIAKTFPRKLSPRQAKLFDRLLAGE
jgi:hypothetical protein